MPRASLLGNLWHTATLPTGSGVDHLSGAGITRSRLPSVLAWARTAHMDPKTGHAFAPCSLPGHAIWLGHSSSHHVLCLVRVRIRASGRTPNASSRLCLPLLHGLKITLFLSAFPFFPSFVTAFPLFWRGMGGLTFSCFPPFCFCIRSAFLAAFSFMTLPCSALHASMLA